MEKYFSFIWNPFYMIYTCFIEKNSFGGFILHLNYFRFQFIHIQIIWVRQKYWHSSHTHTNKCMHTYTHFYTHIHMCTYIHNMCTHINTHIHICVHTYTHLCTHTIILLVPSIMLKCPPSLKREH